MKRPQAVVPGVVAIDRLEVGPPRLESRRITAAYTVWRDGESDSVDFSYRFEEDVFDDDPASLNLASMMLAQVALNYGLFCERIVFKGSFDRHDRRFIEKFAENTAREIYVNKLLMPNEFLTTELDRPTPEKRESYMHASIEFEPHDVERPADPAWSADPSKHAVLSSGGKDSLLSFGVLRELGLGVDPIFVNESGRHWYTALNAYRHLQNTQEGTARVWTNCDRVFAWMLRHLPFIRQDFSRVRSDEYPIRLWTVAVFLFGALPLLRKRSIGRLLIGDEYDTTTRVTHEGIPHYNGLYDQSRFFDEEMTRYFHRKGWKVYQFSILRQMSEMLIQKVLAHRYPELLRLQVSCHASHIENGQSLPCGNCEKCRRIVGMLLALDADPANCGYKPQQVAHCLKELAAKGVHQEAVCKGQLAQMLVERELLPETTDCFRPKPSREGLAMRFHPVRSPIDTFPEDLRAGIFTTFLNHTEGALLRDGRSWKPYEPLGKSAMDRSDESDTRSKGSKSAKGAKGAKGSRYVLGEFTWPEAEARFKQVDVALLPIGAIEQHGPHLPLDTDAYDADYLSRRVAEACSNPRPIVLPLVPYGVSYHHQDFAGTLSVSPETQAQLIYEIGLSAARNGITKLLMINGHGGNGPALHLAAQRINRDAHIFTCVDTGETSDHDVFELLDSPGNDVHAGEIETSTTLSIRPELVQMDKAPKMVPRFSNRYLDFTSKRSVGWYAYTHKISKSGVMGDATKATAEKGDQIWEVMTRRLVELVEDLKRLSLDEIYQRRY